MKEEEKALVLVKMVEVEMDLDRKEEVEKVEIVEVVGMVAEMAEAVAVADGLCLPV